MNDKNPTLKNSQYIIIGDFQSKATDEKSDQMPINDEHVCWKKM